MMKSLLLLSVPALLAACQPGETPANDGVGAENTAVVDTSADDQAIRAKVDLWHELMKAKDAAGIADLYTVDGAVMPPNAPIGIGHDPIEQTWAALVNTPGFELKIVPDQIVVSSSGDMALDRGTYQLTIAPSGETVSDTGKYVVVWQKIDGEWKAAADIFNSDLPAGG